MPVYWVHSSVWRKFVHSVKWYLQIHSSSVYKYEAAIIGGSETDDWEEAEPQNSRWETGWCASAVLPSDQCAEGMWKNQTRLVYLLY